MHKWLFIHQSDLRTEKAQCVEEGKDISALEAEFAALDVPNLHEDAKLHARAQKLLDKTARLSVRKDFAFAEPNKLAAIRRARKDRVKLPGRLPGEDVLHEKAYGGWVGRCAGCMLGKPVEGRKRGQIEKYLKSQNRWPLADYFSNQADPDLLKECVRSAEWRVFRENITQMVEDDDTNYTTVGLAVVRRKGGDFNPQDVANFWMENIPLLHTCTAERVAYRNLANLLPAPDKKGDFPGRWSSANYRNPYREWIGAQIRADFFGYCCPADTQRAAELAWRDACISHVKNGIYGEMWVAAMLAAAYVCDDVETVILAGLSEIPAACRLRKDIDLVFDWRRQGMSYADAVNAVHKQWDEHNGHHWCHTNSNAQIVAMSLLWGEKDFGRTICYAVMPGFDTDCNGATAGSVLGVTLGRSGVPAFWADPLNDTLETGVAGYYQVKLSDMAAQTVDIIRKVRG